MNVRYFEPDICLMCASTARQGQFPATDPPLADNNGTVYGTEFWFCSYACFEKLLRSQLPYQYWPGNDVILDSTLRGRAHDIEVRNPDMWGWFGQLKHDHHATQKIRQLYPEAKEEKQKAIRYIIRCTQQYVCQRYASYVKHKQDMEQIKQELQRRRQGVQRELERWKSDKQRKDYWFKE